MIQKVKLTTREGKKVMGYRVTVTSDFHSNIENIWDKIQTIRRATSLDPADRIGRWVGYSGKYGCIHIHLYGHLPVSYTHLDVYKRQVVPLGGRTCHHTYTMFLGESMVE